MELLDNSITFLATTKSWLKVVIFFLTWIIFWSPFGIYLGKKLKWQFPKPLKIEQKMPLVISLYLIAPIVLWGMVQIKGESWFNYGLQWQINLFLSLILGLLIGILGVIITFYLQFLLNWIQWNSENLIKIKEFVLPVLALGIGISFIEEVIFRGFLIYEFQQSFSLMMAAIISSLIFALLHLIWDYKNAITQLPGLFLMGLILVLARIINDGSIGLAWGLHSGWILGLTCIDSAKIIFYNKEVSPWFTGFNEDPLAGISGIFCLVMTGTILYCFI